MSYPLGPRRTWFWLLRAGPLVLLLSLLPSYASIDHWEEYYQHALRQKAGQPENAAEHTSHEQHCHHGLANCSEQPAPINGRVLPAIVELKAPGLAAFTAIEQQVSRLEGVFQAPTREPPRL